MIFLNLLYNLLKSIVFCKYTCILILIPATHFENVGTVAFSPQPNITIFVENTLSALSSIITVNVFFILACYMTSVVQQAGVPIAVFCASQCATLFNRRQVCRQLGPVPALFYYKATLLYVLAFSLE